MYAIRQAAVASARAFEDTLVALELNTQAFEHLIRPEALQDERGRFRVWAANLGALQRGHSSLDYRLRESPLLHENVLKFLHQLTENLGEIRIVINGGRLPYDQQVRPTDDSDDDNSSVASSITESSCSSSDEEPGFQTELEQRFTDIVDLNNNLYTLSIRIRSPTLRSRALKAAAFRPVVDGVDLLKEYSVFDHQHAKHLILDLRGGQGPALEDVNSYLITRMGNAITKRRQLFLYWRRHRQKLESLPNTHSDVEEDAPMERAGLPTPSQNILVKEGTAVGTDVEKAPVSERNPKSLLSTTTATQHHKSLDDAMEAQSVTSVATTARDISGKVVELPRPPATGEQDFECPYCLTICPARYGNYQSWRNHLLQDLAPYVCTYENCSDPDQLYRSRREWEAHESIHRQVWRCAEHPGITFRSEESFKAHFADAHQFEGFFEQQLVSIARASTTATEDCRMCPFCLLANSLITDLHKHMAHHLERLAIFALPRDVNVEEEKSGGSNEASLGRSELSDSSHSMESYPQDITSSEQDMGSSVDVLIRWKYTDDLELGPLEFTIEDISSALVTQSWLGDDYYKSQLLELNRYIEQWPDLYTKASQRNVPFGELRALRHTFWETLSILHIILPVGQAPLQIAHRPTIDAASSSMETMLAELDSMLLEDSSSNTLYASVVTQLPDGRSEKLQYLMDTPGNQSHEPNERSAEGTLAEESAEVLEPKTLSKLTLPRHSSAGNVTRSIQILGQTVAATFHLGLSPNLIREDFARLHAEGQIRNNLDGVSKLGKDYRGHVQLSWSMDEPIYYCTFSGCHIPLPKRAWKRHEELKHNPRERWICLRNGFRVHSGSSTACIFCGVTDPDRHHKDTCSRISDCSLRRESDRTYSSKKQIVQHVKNFHQASFQESMAGWREEIHQESMTWKCGFCEAELDNWDARAKHIDKHFRDGLHISAWDPALDDEDRMLLRLRYQENLLWTDIATRFETEFGQTYSAEYLHARAEVLKARQSVRAEPASSFPATHQAYSATFYLVPNDVPYTILLGFPYLSMMSVGLATWSYNLLSSGMQRIIHVDNLAPFTTEHEIEALFYPYKGYLGCHIPDQTVKDSQYGFVEFDNYQNAAKAMDGQRVSAKSDVVPLKLEIISIDVSEVLKRTPNTVREHTVAMAFAESDESESEYTAYIAGNQHLRRTNSSESLPSALSVAATGASTELIRSRLANVVQETAKELSSVHSRLQIFYAPVFGARGVLRDLFATKSALDTLVGHLAVAPEDKLTNNFTVDINKFTASLKGFMARLKILLDDSEYTMEFRELWKDFDEIVRIENGITAAESASTCRYLAHYMLDIAQGAAKPAGYDTLIQTTNGFGSGGVTDTSTDPTTENVAGSSSAAEPVLLWKDVDSLAELYAKGILTPRCPFDASQSNLSHRISVLRYDITRLEVDAIVNSTNESLYPSGNLDLAIFKAAGPRIWEDVRSLGGCKVGAAKVSQAWALPCLRVIHAVPPGGVLNRSHSLHLLKAAYRASLDVALEQRLRTVAFPTLGAIRVELSRDEAATAGLEEVKEFLLEHPDAFDRILFCVYTIMDETVYRGILSRTFGAPPAAAELDFIQGSTPSLAEINEPSLAESSEDDFGESYTGGVTKSMERARTICLEMLNSPSFSLPDKIKEQWRAAIRVWDRESMLELIQSLTSDQVIAHRDFLISIRQHLEVLFDRPVFRAGFANPDTVITVRGAIDDVLKSCERNPGDRDTTAISSAESSDAGLVRRSFTRTVDIRRDDIPSRHRIADAEGNIEDSSTSSQTAQKTAREATDTSRGPPPRRSRTTDEPLAKMFASVKDAFDVVSRVWGTELDWEAIQTDLRKQQTRLLMWDQHRCHGSGEALADEQHEELADKGMETWAYACLRDIKEILVIIQELRTDSVDRTFMSHSVLKDAVEVKIAELRRAINALYDLSGLPGCSICREPT